MKNREKLVKTITAHINADSQFIILSRHEGETVIGMNGSVNTLVPLVMQSIDNDESFEKIFALAVNAPESVRAIVKLFNEMRPLSHKGDDPDAEYDPAGDLRELLNEFFNHIKNDDEDGK